MAVLRVLFGPVRVVHLWKKINSRSDTCIGKNFTNAPRTDDHLHSSRGYKEA
jgi:hypothetical protein